MLWLRWNDPYGNRDPVKEEMIRDRSNSTKAEKGTFLSTCQPLERETRAEAIELLLLPLRFKSSVGERKRSWPLPRAEICPHASALTTAGAGTLKKRGNLFCMYAFS